MTANDKPRMNAIAKRAGLLIEILRISRDGGVPVSSLRHDVLMHLVDARFVVVQGQQAMITGEAKGILDAYMATSKQASHARHTGSDLSAMERTVYRHGIVDGIADADAAARRSSKWAHLARCDECGADAGAACRNMDDEVQIAPCVGREGGARFKR